eukprot:9229077-Pyramimonas_sp.AAC.1
MRGYIIAHNARLHHGDLARYSDRIHHGACRITPRLVMCTPQWLRTPTMPVYSTTAAAAANHVCATTPVYTA